jgi:hypothetical protein
MRRIGWFGIFLAAAGATAAAGVLAAPQAVAAVAEPAPSGGDVEVHGESTPPEARAAAEPVCAFYLDALGFAPADRVAWTISADPASAGAVTAPRSDTIAVGVGGQGITENMVLPDGQYRLDWTVAPQRATAAGSRPFTVTCTPAAPTASAAPAAAASASALPTDTTAEDLPAAIPSATTPGTTSAAARAGLGGRLADAGTGLRGVIGLCALLILAGSSLAFRRRTP